MKWNSFAESLRDLCSGPTRLREGTVFVPRRPVDLDKNFQSLAKRNRKFADLLDDFSKDEVLDEIARQAGWRSQTVVQFEWGAFGPMSSALSLKVLDADLDREFYCVSQEDEPLWIVGALKPKRSPGLTSAFVRRLLDSNGV